jgi:hypothetical protein
MHWSIDARGGGDHFKHLDALSSDEIGGRDLSIEIAIG